MRKIRLALSLTMSALLLTGCGEVAKSSITSSATNVSTPSSVITSNPKNENEVLDSEIKIQDFKSDYTPHIAESLPRISITSSTGKDDFVTKPVSYAVKEQKKGWISDPKDPQLTAPDPYYEDCVVSVTDEANLLTIDSATAQVKVRGNWTTDYEKKPLRIKFTEKQSMLGLNDNLKAKSWVLLASYKDWSLLRDAVGLYLGKLMSRNYTSDFRLVDVYINNSYYGAYLLVEQQQVSKGRININSPKENYTGTDIGYLMEFDGYSQYEDYNFYMDYNGALVDVNGKATTGLQSGYSIKSDIYSNNQANFIGGYMNKLWDICYSAVYDGIYKEFDSNYNVISSSKTNAYDVVKSVIDIESLVDAYIMQDFICDPDIYWSSFYMNIDMSSTGDKLLRFDAPWDFDSSFGNKYNLNNAQGLYAGVVGMDVNKSYECANPWMLLFARCTWFKSLVSQKWKMLKSNNVFDKLVDYIDSIESKNNSALEKNFTRWPNTMSHSGVLNEICENSKMCKTQKEASSYLKSWIIARTNNLNNIYK